MDQEMQNEQSDGRDSGEAFPSRREVGSLGSGIWVLRVVFGSVGAEWITTIRGVFHIMKPSLKVGFSRSVG